MVSQAWLFALVFSLRFPGNLACVELSDCNSNTARWVKVGGEEQLCPWMVRSTSSRRYCADGNDTLDARGCQGRGGTVLCPIETPYMCKDPFCLGDYCCLETAESCDSFGGPRLCPTAMPTPMPTQSPTPFPSRVPTHTPTQGATATSPTALPTAPVVLFEEEDESGFPWWILVLLALLFCCCFCCIAAFAVWKRQQHAHDKRNFSATENDMLLEGLDERGSPLPKVIPKKVAANTYEYEVEVTFPSGGLCGPKGDKAWLRTPVLELSFAGLDPDKELTKDVCVRMQDISGDAKFGFHILDSSSGAAKAALMRKSGTQGFRAVPIHRNADWAESKFTMKNKVLIVPSTKATSKEGGKALLKVSSPHALEVRLLAFDDRTMRMSTHLEIRGAAKGQKVEGRRRVPVLARGTSQVYEVELDALPGDGPAWAPGRMVRKLPKGSPHDFEMEAGDDFTYSAPELQGGQLAKVFAKTAPYMYEVTFQMSSSCGGPKGTVGWTGNPMLEVKRRRDGLSTSSSALTDLRVEIVDAGGDPMFGVHVVANPAHVAEDLPYLVPGGPDRGSVEFKGQEKAEGSIHCPRDGNLFFVPSTLASPTKSGSLYMKVTSLVPLQLNLLPAGSDQKYYEAHAELLACSGPQVVRPHELLRVLVKGTSDVYEVEVGVLSGAAIDAHGTQGRIVQKLPKGTLHDFEGDMDFVTGGEDAAPSCGQAIQVWPKSAPYMYEVEIDMPMGPVRKDEAPILEVKARPHGRATFGNDKVVVSMTDIAGKGKAKLGFCITDTSPLVEVRRPFYQGDAQMVEVKLNGKSSASGILPVSERSTFIVPSMLDDIGGARTKIRIESPVELDVFAPATLKDTAVSDVDWSVGSRNGSRQTTAIRARMLAKGTSDVYEVELDGPFGYAAVGRHAVQKSDSHDMGFDMEFGQPGGKPQVVAGVVIKKLPQGTVSEFEGELEIRSNAGGRVLQAGQRVRLIKKVPAYVYEAEIDIPPCMTMGRRTSPGGTEASVLEMKQPLGAALPQEVVVSMVDTAGDRKLGFVVMEKEPSPKATMAPGSYVDGGLQVAEVRLNGNRSASGKVQVHDHGAYILPRMLAESEEGGRARIRIESPCELDVHAPVGSVRARGEVDVTTTQGTFQKLEARRIVKVKATGTGDLFEAEVECLPAAGGRRSVEGWVVRPLPEGTVHDFEVELAAEANNSARMEPIVMSGEKVRVHPRPDADVDLLDTRPTELRAEAWWPMVRASRPGQADAGADYEVLGSRTAIKSLLPRRLVRVLAKGGGEIYEVEVDVLPGAGSTRSTPGRVVRPIPEGSEYDYEGEVNISGCNHGNGFLSGQQIRVLPKQCVRVYQADVELPAAGAQAPVLEVKRLMPMRCSADNSDISVSVEDLGGGSKFGLRAMAHLGKLTCRTWNADAEMLEPELGEIPMRGKKKAQGRVQFRGEHAYLVPSTNVDAVESGHVRVRIESPVALDTRPALMPKSEGGLELQAEGEFTTVGNKRIAATKKMQLIRMLVGGTGVYEAQVEVLPTGQGNWESAMGRLVRKLPKGTQYEYEGDVDLLQSSSIQRAKGAEGLVRVTPKAAPFVYEVECDMPPDGECGPKGSANWLCNPTLQVMLAAGAPLQAGPVQLTVGIVDLGGDQKFGLHAMANPMHTSANHPVLVLGGPMLAEIPLGRSTKADHGVQLHDRSLFLVPSPKDISVMGGSMLVRITSPVELEVRLFQRGKPSYESEAEVLGTMQNALRLPSRRVVRAMAKSTGEIYEAEVNMLPGGKDAMCMGVAGRILRKLDIGEGYEYEAEMDFLGNSASIDTFGPGHLARILPKVSAQIYEMEAELPGDGLSGPKGSAMWMANPLFAVSPVGRLPASGHPEIMVHVKDLGGDAKFGLHAMTNPTHKIGTLPSLRDDPVELAVIPMPVKSLDAQGAVQLTEQGFFLVPSTLKRSVEGGWIHVRLESPVSLHARVVDPAAADFQHEIHIEDVNGGRGMSKCIKAVRLVKVMAKGTDDVFEAEVDVVPVGFEGMLKAVPGKVVRKLGKGASFDFEADVDIPLRTASQPIIGQQVRILAKQPCFSYNLQLLFPPSGLCGPKGTDMWLQNPMVEISRKKEFKSEASMDSTITVQMEDLGGDPKFGFHVIRDPCAAEHAEADIELLEVPLRLGAKSAEGCCKLVADNMFVVASLLDMSEHGGRCSLRISSSEDLDVVVLPLVVPEELQSLRTMSSKAIEYEVDGSLSKRKESMLPSVNGRNKRLSSAVVVDAELDFVDAGNKQGGGKLAKMIQRSLPAALQKQQHQFAATVQFPIDGLSGPFGTPGWVRNPIVELVDVEGVTSEDSQVPVQIIMEDVDGDDKFGFHLMDGIHGNAEQVPFVNEDSTKVEREAVMKGHPLRIIPSMLREHNHGGTAHIKVSSTIQLDMRVLAKEVHHNYTVEVDFPPCMCGPMGTAEWINNPVLEVSRQSAAEDVPVEITITMEDLWGDPKYGFHIMSDVTEDLEESLLSDVAFGGNKHAGDMAALTGDKVFVIPSLLASSKQGGCARMKIVSPLPLDIQVMSHDASVEEEELAIMDVKSRSTLRQTRMSTALRREPRGTMHIVEAEIEILGQDMCTTKARGKAERLIRLLKKPARKTEVQPETEVCTSRALRSTVHSTVPALDRKLMRVFELEVDRNAVDAAPSHGATALIKGELAQGSPFEFFADVPSHHTGDASDDRKVTARVFPNLCKYELDLVLPKNGACGPRGSWEWLKNPIVEIKRVDPDKACALMVPEFTIAMQDIKGDPKFGFHVLANPHSVPKEHSHFMYGGPELAEVRLPAGEAFVQRRVHLPEGKVFVIPSTLQASKKGGKVQLNITSPVELSLRILPQRSQKEQDLLQAMAVQDTDLLAKHIEIACHSGSSPELLKEADRILTELAGESSARQELAQALHTQNTSKLRKAMRRAAQFEGLADVLSGCGDILRTKDLHEDDVIQALENRDFLTLSKAAHDLSLDFGDSTTLERSREVLSSMHRYVVQVDFPPCTSSDHFAQSGQFHQRNGPVVQVKRTKDLLPIVHTNMSKRESKAQAAEGADGEKRRTGKTPHKKGGKKAAGKLKVSTGDITPKRDQKGSVSASSVSSTLESRASCKTSDSVDSGAIQLHIGMTDIGGDRKEGFSVVVNPDKTPSTWPGVCPNAIELGHFKMTRHDREAKAKGVPMEQSCVYIVPQQVKDAANGGRARFEIISMEELVINVLPPLKWVTNVHMPGEWSKAHKTCGGKRLKTKMAWCRNPQLRVYLGSQGTGVHTIMATLRVRDKWHNIDLPHSHHDDPDHVHQDKKQTLSPHNHHPRVGDAFHSTVKQLAGHRGLPTPDAANSLVARLKTSTQQPHSQKSSPRGADLLKSAVQQVSYGRSGAASPAEQESPREVMGDKATDATVSPAPQPDRAWSIHAVVNNHTDLYNIHAGVVPTPTGHKILAQPVPEYKPDKHMTLCFQVTPEDLASDTREKRAPLYLVVSNKNAEEGHFDLQVWCDKEISVERVTPYTGA